MLQRENANVLTLWQQNYKVFYPVAYRDREGSAVLT